MLKTFLHSIAIVFLLVTGANAQSNFTFNATPFTGTAIGSGYTFTGAGTQLVASNVTAYQNLNLPMSTSLWVHYPTLAVGATNPYLLNGLNTALTSGFAVWAPVSGGADSLLLQSYLQPNVTNCSGAKRMCANIGLINDSGLHHLCTTWSATGSAFYVDSILRSQGPSGASMTPGNTGWILGQNVPSGTAEVDVAVWNRALSPSECVAIFNRGHAGFSLLSGNAPASLNTGLIAYWSLSNCTGSSPVTCADGSPTNNPVSTDPAPTVLVTSPTNGSSGIIGTITVSATCTDTHSVTRVVLSIDGNQLASFTSGPYQTSFDTTLLLDANNPHTATAVCTNGAGVTSTANNTFSTNNGVVAAKTFFLATAAAGGSDSNPGTALSPWLSPNHALRCGDKILAAPSQSYSAANFNNWGTVWSCPTAVDPGSSVQFAFLQCNGSFIQDCYVNESVGNAINVNANHWAVANWMASASATRMHCFQVSSVPNVTPSREPIFVLFLNDYARVCAGGMSLQDYEAWVGGLIYGSGFNSGLCPSGISSGQPINTNPADTGTHIFIGGTFLINNGNQNGCTDGEGVIYDDWFNNSYNGIGTIEQSLFISNMGAGWEKNGSRPPYPAYSIANVINNTFWGNGLGPTAGGAQIYMSDNGGHCCGENNFFIDSNIAVSTSATTCVYRISPFTCPPGTAVTLWVVNLGGCQVAGQCAVTNNYLWNTVTGATNLITANAPNPAPYDTTGNVGADPGLASPVLVPSAPDCSVSATALACVAAIRANFVPSGGAAAKGYQPPGSCTPDALYPIWLKGAVPDGLLTKPCGY